MYSDMLSKAKSIQEIIVSHRRYLHANAEVGFELHKTKAYVRTKLEELGYQVNDCGRCGLVTTIGGKKPGKVFLLRADMDALPIQEESGEEFASRLGAMHACGHDMHTAMLLGAAQLLKMYENKIHGIVKLMFQPAEEIFEGSYDMIQAGVLEHPRVDAAMMLHVTPGIPFPVGTAVVSSPGVSAPAADYFTIHVQGKGCHGSTPQAGVDALTAAAHILIALQEIQARELGIGDDAVLTIGQMHGGTASNAIADSATMGGTVRTFDEKIREMVKERICEIASGVAKAFRAEAKVSFDSGCPSLMNDRNISESVTNYIEELLGNAYTTAGLNPSGKPSAGGSEDFAYISREVPSVMVALAAGEPQKGYGYTVHHPKVTFDEAALPIGSAIYAYCALRYLGDAE